LKPTFGSLFTGIGGFDLGLERAGWECRWQVENDKFCNQVLEKHWPDVKRYGDIKDVEHPESVDLICGGFPCQDLSVAGKRAGLGGDRSGLFWEFIRIIKESSPPWILIENVPGWFSSNSGEDFRIALEAMDECGYGVAWRVLNSQYFGIPQRRRRIFIVGSLGRPCPPEVLFESDTELLEEIQGGVVSYTLTASCQLSKTGAGESGTLVGTLKASGFTQSRETYLASINPNRMRETSGISRWVDTNPPPDMPRYKALGNAVTVSVIVWIGKRILKL